MVRVVTGTAFAADGTLNVGTDSGDGTAIDWVVTGTTKYAKGSVVYEGVRPLGSVWLTNPTTNGWIGKIEYSWDGGATWTVPECSSGCTTATCQPTLHKQPAHTQCLSDGPYHYVKEV